MAIPTIRTRVFENRDELGFATDGELADKIGMSIRAVGLVRSGKRIPHNQFIAGVMAAFPGYLFSELFKLVME